MHAFHKPLVTSLNKLSCEGFTFQVGEVQVHSFVYPLLSTLDLQAKAFWLNMVAHNGSFGCSNCHIKGITVKSGKGIAHSYPYTEFKSTTLRTAESFLHDAEEAHATRKPVHGIKGYSLLLCLNHHNIVMGTTIDYMHGLLLGVVKSLVNLWFSPSKYNKNKDFFIGHQVRAVDKRLMRMKPPDFIPRCPRSIATQLPRFKGINKNVKQSI